MALAAFSDVNRSDVVKTFLETISELSQKNHDAGKKFAEKKIEWSNSLCNQKLTGMHDFLPVLRKLEFIKFSLIYCSRYFNIAGLVAAAVMVKSIQTRYPKYIHNSVMNKTKATTKVSGTMQAGP